MRSSSPWDIGGNTAIFPVHLLKVPAYVFSFFTDVPSLISRCIPFGFPCTSRSCRHAQIPAFPRRLPVYCFRSLRQGFHSYTLFLYAFPWSFPMCFVASSITIFPSSPKPSPCIPNARGTHMFRGPTYGVYFPMPRFYSTSWREQKLSFSSKLCRQTRDSLRLGLALVTQGQRNTTSSSFFLTL